MSDPRSKPSGSWAGALLLGPGAVVVAVACCAGPALLAGTLALAGGALGNPAVLGGSALVLAASLGYDLRRRIRGRARGGAGLLPQGVDGMPSRRPAAEDCCAPAGRNAATEDTGGRRVC